MAPKNKTKKKSLSINKNLNDQLIDFSKKSTDDVLEYFHSTPNGLSTEQSEQNRNAFGANVIGKNKEHLWYHSLFDAIINPFTIILLVIAILDIAIPRHENNEWKFNPDWPAFSIIMIMLIITCFIKAFQEVRSNKASEKLHDMIETTAAVERNGIKKEIPIDEIVPGDIIHLASGDMVPADLMILSAKDLFITQSSLTGESEPIEKFSTNNSTTTNALEVSNLCFMGTSVSSGTARAIVLSVGQNTFFGTIAKSITKKRPKTNFDKGIKSVSLLLLITTAIMVSIIFVLQGAIAHDWIGGLTFALALAVGLTPEMLPVVVTVNLAKEAFRLSKQKTIVKNISSIQSFGAMDVLCTDKTGTLTEDKIILERHINVEGKEDKRVLIYGYLNSHFQTGLKNLLDLAIIDKAKQEQLEDLTNHFIKIDEIPFDFQRRRMSVIISNPNKLQQLITKGAIEEILNVCDYAEYKGKVVKLNLKLRNEIHSTVKALNEQGMRVIAIATNHKTLPNDYSFGVKDEKGMKLIGYVALLDPPKMSSRKAILDLQRKGVNVKVLTGDNDAVAKYICSQVGLRGKKIILGNEIEQMSQNVLEKKVMDYTIFAKLSPEQKARVVLAIRANKHVVGFMGDGINDAAAMRAADLGISVDTAVDIAKESADIILLEKDLTILGNGCVEGRKTYANIIKYIKMTVSSNFGNMLSMLVASIWLGMYGIMPMRPEQILILNLIYDFAQIAMPWDNVDADFYNKPRSWNARSILRFMLFIGPISSIFDIATFLIMFYGLKWNNTNPHWTDHGNQMLNYFQTGWFLESFLTQVAVVIVLRSNKFPFHNTIPSLSITLALLASLLVGSILVLTPGLDPMFHSLVQCGAPQIIGYIFALLIGYIAFSQLGKITYIKIFHSWL